MTGNSVDYLRKEGRLEQAICCARESEDNGLVQDLHIEYIENLRVKESAQKLAKLMELKQYIADIEEYAKEYAIERWNKEVIKP